MTLAPTLHRVGAFSRRNRTTSARVQPGMDDELWDIALWEAECQQWLLDSGRE